MFKTFRWASDFIDSRSALRCAARFFWSTADNFLGVRLDDLDALATEAAFLVRVGVFFLPFAYLAAPLPLDFLLEPAALDCI